jgi:hypothetical protein
MSQIKYIEDTEFKKGETPNANELKLFENEKMELYKGTFVVCIVYGLSALLLLLIILFTEWGREYIYNKFAPAVITYILGSLIIIIYLLNAIFTLQPRKVGRVMDGDNNILCPDYWKLEKVPDYIKEGIIKNNIYDVNNNIIPQINSVPNSKIKYRCVYDRNVFGNTEQYNTMNNELIETNKYKPGFTDMAVVNNYITAKAANIATTIEPDYIVINQDTNKNSPYYKDLKKYAMFTGAYSSNNDNGRLISGHSNILRVFTDKTKPYNADNKDEYLNAYEAKSPLICNIVYPQVLGILDSETKDKNEVSCEYAKQCGISWSSLKCK